MVNNTDGSTIGYKYYNFSRTYGKAGLSLALNCDMEGTSGKIDVYLDHPSEAEGGVKIGSFAIPATTGAQELTANVEVLKHYNGKHALFLVISSETKGKSICRINSLIFQSTK